VVINAGITKTPDLTANVKRRNWRGLSGVFVMYETREEEWKAWKM
jgi:hypothetical protein